MNFQTKNKNIMTRVYAQLNCFIQNINFYYESVGLQYRLDPFFDTFVKLVTPDNFSSNFVNETNQNTFHVNYFNSLKPYYPKQISQENKSINQINQEIKTFTKSNEEQSHSFYDQMAEIKPIKRITQKNEIFQAPSFPRYDLNLQKEVFNWIVNMFRSGNHVRTYQMCQFAKRSSKNPGFVGSTGWARNFLNRYPELKQLVKNKSLRNASRSEVIKKFQQLMPGIPIIQNNAQKYENELQEHYYAFKDMNVKHSKHANGFSNKEQNIVFQEQLSKEKKIYCSDQSDSLQQQPSQMQK